jgi:hypothetical protein
MSKAPRRLRDGPIEQNLKLTNKATIVTPIVQNLNIHFKLVEIIMVKVYLGRSEDLPFVADSEILEAISL